MAEGSRNGLRAGEDGLRRRKKTVTDDFLEKEKGWAAIRGNGDGRGEGMAAAGEDGARSY